MDPFERDLLIAVARIAYTLGTPEQQKAIDTVLAKRVEANKTMRWTAEITNGH
jgi:hypothetical protein